MRNSFDITSRKHKNADTSVAAHNRVMPTKIIAIEEIFRLFCDRDETGTTLKEACRHFGKFSNELSGRFSDMSIRLKSIYDTGERRENSRVYRAVRCECQHIKSAHNKQGVCMSNNCVCFNYRRAN